MQIRAARFFVYVTDLPRSLHFYTELLGLSVVDRVVGGTVLSMGALEFELLQERRDEDESLDRRTGFMLFVADADAAFTELAAEGVTILTELSTAADGSRVFYVADPDGLPIGILQEPRYEMPPADWLYEEQ